MVVGVDRHWEVHTPKGLSLLQGNYTTGLVGVGRVSEDHWGSPPGGEVRGGEGNRLLPRRGRVTDVCGGIPLTP